LLAFSRQAYSPPINARTLAHLRLHCLSARRYHNGSKRSLAVSFPSNSKVLQSSHAFGLRSYNTAILQDMSKIKLATVARWGCVHHSTVVASLSSTIAPDFARTVPRLSPVPAVARSHGPIYCRSHAKPCQPCQEKLQVDETIAKLSSIFFCCPASADNHWKPATCRYC